MNNGSVDNGLLDDTIFPDGCKAFQNCNRHAWKESGLYIGLLKNEKKSMPSSVTLASVEQTACKRSLIRFLFHSSLVVVTENQFQ